MSARDTFSAGVRREKPEFGGSAFLGTGIFRVDGRAGRRVDTGVHQEPRKGRPASEPAKPALVKFLSRL